MNLKRIIGAFKKVAENPAKLFVYFSALRISRIVPDSLYLKLLFRGHMRQKLDLEHPMTYNQKLQWLKLYYRPKILTTLVDKYAVRSFISEKIGEQYLIPLVGVWDSVAEIDFNTLPNQFVLKPTQTSGDVIVCIDKNSLDFKSVKQKLNKWLKREYFWLHREWPYKNVPPRIIAEKYMVDESGYELKDYKFFCFDGEVKAMFVAKDRNVPGEETKFDFYDEDFNLLPIKNGHENSENPISKPESYEKMLAIARVLSKGFPHVRVDLYDINGQIYFGEMTFYHWSGFVPFEPEEWDSIWGSYIKLPTKPVIE